jgi:hypothetical protein
MSPYSANMVEMIVEVDNRLVESLLLRLDTALSPFAIAAFLGGPVEEYIQGRAENRFRQEGDDVSGKWAPLKDATQAIRAQEGYGADGPIDRRTDRLMHYIVGSPGRSQATGLGATLTYPGTPPTGELLTKVQTAQRGKPYPNTPPRPVLGLGEEDLAQVLILLSIYTEEAIHGI